MRLTIICEHCGETAPRTGPVQKYCAACSEIRDRARKRKWARENPQDRQQVHTNAAKRKERVIEAGKLRSVSNSIAWMNELEPLLWVSRVTIPFSYAASKNHIYSLNAEGHRALRKGQQQMAERITVAMRRALHCQTVVQNKLYLDILVEKPNHRGDAVNVLDLVSDAIQEATGLDDRWHSIRRLDWSISKNNPRLMIGIGQTSDQNVQVCSHCGQLYPFDQFNKASGNKSGVGRACKGCRSAGRRLSA